MKESFWKTLSCRSCTLPLPQGNYYVKAFLQSWKQCWKQLAITYACIPEIPEFQMCFILLAQDIQLWFCSHTTVEFLVGLCFDLGSVSWTLNFGYSLPGLLTVCLCGLQVQRQYEIGRSQQGSGIPHSDILLSSCFSCDLSGSNDLGDVGSSFFQLCILRCCLTQLPTSVARTTSVWSNSIRDLRSGNSGLQLFLFWSDSQVFMHWGTHLWSFCVPSVEISLIFLQCCKAQLIFSTTSGMGGCLRVNWKHAPWTKKKSQCIIHFFLEDDLAAGKLANVQSSSL